MTRHDKAWRDFEETRKRGRMTDKQLEELLPTLPVDKRLEALLAKYIGGAVSYHYDGETPLDVADARIAIYLTRKILPWLSPEAAK